MEHHITKSNSALQAPAQVPAGQTTAISSRGLICDKLEYWKNEDQTTYYYERADGCLWVYLLDEQGNAVSGMQHFCRKGNVLTVDGPHSFGCNC